MEAGTTKGLLRGGGPSACRRARAAVRAPAVRALLYLAAAGLAVLLLTHSRLAGVDPLHRQRLPGVDARSAESYVADERLLRQITEECARREDSVIYVNATGHMVVEASADISANCPLMDIMLRGQERGVGTCTDVAFYVMHAGGRIIPMLSAPERARYDAACGARTARLLLETVYGEFVSDDPAVKHYHLLNSEHMWKADEANHRRVNVFLCKTRFCASLLRAHVAAKRWGAEVALMGHSSSDPLVDLPLGLTREKAGFLHVKGKSGLKHTSQLLECWAGRPDLPPLHVVGRFTWDEVAKVAAAPNVVVYPKVTQASSKQQTEHISFQDTRNLQARMPIHVCASEREGFGHYINEARASAAAVISTDHPPMNELITERSGILIAPERTDSYPEQALGGHAAINAFLSPSQLCGAAGAALALRPRELKAKARAARLDYVREKAEFYRRLAALRAQLLARREDAERGLAAAGAAGAAVAGAAAAAVGAAAAAAAAGAGGLAVGGLPQGAGAGVTQR